MKTLLVPVTLHDALPSVFATAVLVARRFGSLIEGVALRPALAEYVPVDMVGGMTWLRDEEADQAEAQDAGQRFVAAMEAAGLPGASPAPPAPRMRWPMPGRATAGSPTCRPATPSSASTRGCSRRPWSGAPAPMTARRA
ncbi:hypothetical protein GCM10025880_44960 [Methylorubrum aminovorans]|nr:hypothetical protein [Methylorubrum aminovorans]GMA78079.1 hypothetical protein GCM10025880_44960 [Methylorubrum aminovorans]